MENKKLLSLINDRLKLDDLIKKKNNEIKSIEKTMENKKKQLSDLKTKKDNQYKKMLSIAKSKPEYKKQLKSYYKQCRKRSDELHDSANETNKDTCSSLKLYARSSDLASKAGISLDLLKDVLAKKL